MKKIKKKELLEERLVALEKEMKGQNQLVGDLLDYLMRVDANFVNNPGTFEGWYDRLSKLRLDEGRKHDCIKAKRILEENGYVVAKDANGLDAAKVKKWVETDKKNDDDIPF